LAGAALVALTSTLTSFSTLASFLASFAGLDSTAFLVSATTLGFLTDSLGTLCFSIKAL
jgi:hypothetical protein